MYYVRFGKTYLQSLRIDPFRVRFVENRGNAQQMALSTANSVVKRLESNGYKVIVEWAGP